MKKTRDISFILNIPVWDGVLVFGMGDPTKAYKRNISKYLDDEDMERHLGVCQERSVLGCANRSKRGASMLWVKVDPNYSPAAMGDLIHEVGHATNHILQSKGMGFHHKSEEAFTYLNGYLVEQILTKLKRKK